MCNQMKSLIENYILGSHMNKIWMKVKWDIITFPIYKSVSGILNFNFY